ncbi:MAG: hypothetical protein EA417_14545 [Gammaproteobacteria bacterium]|nr:MAG: hypothetical protein EA417_14545 [Gammaproteobacteria bacterium]
MPAEPHDATPRIERALVAPGHDGSAELLLRIRYGDGSSDSVTLDAAAAERLLDQCGATALEQLVGQPWRRLLNVLEQSGD